MREAANHKTKSRQVDILLATYNGDKYLRQQIDSILNQTYENWKLIVRDDGSTDNTTSIIEGYRDIVPDKIVVLNDDLGKLGVTNNFAKLLEHSQSDYTMLADQDDIWLPRKIELTYNKMRGLVEKHSGDVPLLVYTDYKIVDANMCVIIDSYWKRMKIDPKSARSLARSLVFNVTSGCTIMINRKLRDLSLPMPADIFFHDWWLGLVSTAVGKNDYVQEATLLHRLHATNVAGFQSNASINAIVSQFRGLSRLKRETRVYLIGTQKQAMALSSRYEDILNDKDFEKISTYANLDSFNPVIKRFYILKHGFWWYGIMRNVALLLVI